MVKLINNKDNKLSEKGFILFNIFSVSFGIRKGVLVDTISLNIKLSKFELAIFLGKESKDGEKTKQKLKESTNNVASA